MLTSWGLEHLHAGVVTTQHSVQTHSSPCCHVEGVARDEHKLAVHQADELAQRPCGVLVATVGLDVSDRRAWQDSGTVGQQQGQAYNAGASQLMCLMYKQQWDSSRARDAV
jgi:hypothetical protein